MMWNSTTHPPRIFVSSLPAEEHKNADHLNILLGSVKTHVDGFRSALRLFEHCWEQRRIAMATSQWIYDRDRDHDAWIFIAARAAAMEVFHIEVTLGSIRALVGKCSTLIPYLDTADLKLTQQMFESQFNRARRLRHAISHASEMMADPDRFARNFQIPDSAVWLISSLEDRTLGFTHEGERIYIEVSEPTLAKLESIAERIFDAFRPMSAATFAMPPRPATPSENQTDHQ